MGDYKSAKDGYQKALEIFKKHYGEDHINYAYTLGNLSGVLEAMGDYKSAKDGYQKALEICKKHFGEDHIEYASCLGNLSGVLKIWEITSQPRTVIRRH
jgi:tetratricopeptide (TPR) repeat protein